ncbi:MAG: lysylphosphatidylglycerol synthase domain-containing protein [Candidatus Wallbacteria bacterium]|nr:lysylphosphatidylglycerol synthase domain-containing protein [Candidatus Wallbacteria bacterium]
MAKKVSFLDKFQFVFGTALFCFCIFLLVRSLGHFRYRDIMREIGNLPLENILLAVILTFANFMEFIVYDFLAIRNFQHKVGTRSLVFGTFVSFSVVNTAGYSLITGSTLRRFLYRDAQLTYLDCLKIVVFNGITLLLGLILMNGIGFLLNGGYIAGRLQIPKSNVQVAGFVFLLMICLYVLATIFYKKPLIIKTAEFRLPSPAVTLGQFLLGALDLLLIGSVLYCLLPARFNPSFFQYFSVFLLSFLSGIISTVPGGLGVFELCMVYFLSPHLSQSAILGSLLAFRGIYYLFPLLLGLATFTIHVLVTKK